MQQQTNNNTQYVEEDTIDLRELFTVLKRRKKLISLVTVIITILAIVYSLVKTPIYEAKALIEIGNYKSLDNNKILLDDSSLLAKKLNVLFIDVFENVKDKESEITSIIAPEEKKFLEIEAVAINNEKAELEIQKLLSYTQKKHQKILNDIKQRQEFEIQNIETRVNIIKTREVDLLNKKMTLKQDSINTSKRELLTLVENFKKNTNTESDFIALQLMQKRDLQQNIANIENGLLDIQNEKIALESTTINELLTKKALLSSMLLPHNYKNTKIVGKIITNDYPVKPKKKLIVIVAFITGLMLSVFLAFFLEFIAGMKEEDSGL